MSAGYLQGPRPGYRLAIMAGDPRIHRLETKYMGILDELKQQASEKRQLEADEERERHSQEERYRQELLPRMQQLHAYLKEFVEHLNYVRPEIVVTVYDDGRRGLNHLLQGGYHLATDEHGGQSSLDNLKTVRLTYHCSADGEYRYTLTGKKDIEKEMHILSDAGISYSHRPVAEMRREMVEEFSVLRKVPVMIEFKADAYSMNINLTIRNHESTGTRYYEISPAQIDEKFLEEMANYILRRESSFMRTELSGDERAQLRKNYLEDKQQRSTLNAEEKSELKQLKKQLGSSSGNSLLSRLFGRSRE
jgi:hypothetical protein